jgi:hypothetical protein
MTFELACLVEQAEFELPCGLPAAVRLTMAAMDISVAAAAE